jgi:2-polyprenyl-3-methyl-5-hydroxy-6-metoxy-1,4-benzoquinol methylase
VPKMTGRSKTNACPMCGGENEHAFEASDRNREVTPERFSYDRCTTCGTLFISEVPDDIASYYRNGYPFDADGLPLWRSNPRRLAAESYRVNLLKQFVGDGHLIDVGAGSGGFSAAAHDAGFEVTAIEMDPQCCDYLEGEVGVKVIRTDNPLAALSALPRARVIVLWHVFEHLFAPNELFTEIAQKLEDGGILAIAVPNPRSLQFRLMRARWAHLDAPRHLLLVQPAALIGKANDLGMTCVATTTTDPDGLECNFFGWLNGIRRRPARTSPSKITQYAALGVCRAMAPLERSGLRGAAVTLVFRKDANQASYDEREVS